MQECGNRRQPLRGHRPGLVTVICGVVPHGRIPAPWKGVIPVRARPEREAVVHDEADRRSMGLNSRVGDAAERHGMFGTRAPRPAHRHDLSVRGRSSVPNSGERNPGPSQIKVHQTTGEGHSRVGVLVSGVTVGVWASGGREEPEGRRDEHGDQKGDAEQEGPFDPRTAGPPLLER